MSYKGLIDLSRSVRAFFFPRCLLSAAVRPSIRASATVFRRELGLSSGLVRCCRSRLGGLLLTFAPGGSLGKTDRIRFEVGTSPARAARPGGASRLALGLGCLRSRVRVEGNLRPSEGKGVDTRKPKAFRSEAEARPSRWARPDLHRSARRSRSRRDRKPWIPAASRRRSGAKRRPGPAGSRWS